MRKLTKIKLEVAQVVYFGKTGLHSKWTWPTLIFPPSILAITQNEGQEYHRISQKVSQAEIVSAEGESHLGILIKVISTKHTNKKFIICRYIPVLSLLS